MDYDQLVNEATRYLQEYVRIQTVNPPGSETAGAEFFREIFEAESIPCKLFEPSPGRGSLLATLKGDGSRRPILLLSHIDVVPVERDHWDVDPFGGVIKDGYLYGRGTLDDKAMGIVEMMVLLILKRERMNLKRDILFFASADEEAGGGWGVDWAIDHVPALREAEYALNEGGHVQLNDSGMAERYEVSSGQKLLFQLKLRARGKSGHGSMPHPDNPNVKLVHALERITSWETPFEILPMVAEYFRKIAPRQAPEDRPFFEDIEKGLKDPSFSKRLTASLTYNAMVRNTISLNVLQAGSKVNVIPSEAIANLDCRLIPGSSKEAFLREVKKRLGEEIEVEIMAESQSHPPSAFDTDLYRAIERFASKNDPGCPVVPLLLPGATDGRFLRERGVVTYDFCPFRLTDEENLKMHGNNERISIENLRFGIRMMVEAMKEVAT